MVRLSPGQMEVDLKLAGELYGDAQGILMNGM